MARLVMYTCRVVKSGSLQPTGKVLHIVAADMFALMAELDVQLEPDERARVTGRYQHPEPASA